MQTLINPAVSCRLLCVATIGDGSVGLFECGCGNTVHLNVAEVESGQAVCCGECDGTSTVQERVEKLRERLAFIRDNIRTVGWQDRNKLRDEEHAKKNELFCLLDVLGEKPVWGRI